MTVSEKILADTDESCCVGIDIGTTTICAFVLQLSDGKPIGIYTILNDADLPASFPGDKRQDVNVIVSRVQKLTETLVARYPTIRSIGVTGQMHGILCTDLHGNALSPLYTWQDERAGLGSPSACEKLSSLTGYRIASGYGLATLYALIQNNEVPLETARISTITDFVASKLCQTPVKIMHTTNAGSLGLFDFQNDCFDLTALSKAEIPVAWLPGVTASCIPVGTYCEIPVSIAIGDNQASFLGAVRDPSTTALVNFGTGSQISLWAIEKNIDIGRDPSVELRPFPEQGCLVSGSALCGGRAYAMLEQFFRAYVVAAGLPDHEQYQTLNRLAVQGLREERERGERLHVQTTFCGTRDDASTAGSVTNIYPNLMTPQALAAGFVRGMAEELYAMFSMMPHDHVKQLVASGNAVQRNPALREVLADVFSLPVLLPKQEEEAALGAAIVSAYAAGLVDSLHAMGEWVMYHSKIEEKRE